MDVRALCRRLTEVFLDDRLLSDLPRKFNVAVAELDFHDEWQSSTVGVVTLSNAEQHVEESLQHVLAEAQRILGPVLVDHSVDLL